MTFAELKAEVLARGFQFQDSARVGRWVNQAYTEICDQEDWPFLRTQVTAAAPVTIADLGVVESATIGRRKLEPIDQVQLVYDFVDLTAEGTPHSYYRSPTGVGVYPVDDALVTVTYWRVPVDLVADASVPVVPARFHELIVLGALRRAALEESDGPDYGAFDAEWQRGVQTMRERVMLWHRDGGYSAASEDS